MATDSTIFCKLLLCVIIIVPMNMQFQNKITYLLTRGGDGGGGAFECIITVKVVHIVRTQQAYDKEISENINNIQTHLN